MDYCFYEVNNNTGFIGFEILSHQIPLFCPTAQRDFFCEKLELSAYVFKLLTHFLHISGEVLSFVNCLVCNGEIKNMNFGLCQ